ncbi:hypothetical protein [Rheinheimera soli]|uniref:hypothetical protein n=1 Tax=Rheinheimera soli TaxID=443616 RepID=UPI001E29028F|nr:hypothetical protein [Rheinheimera soli]
MKYQVELNRNNEISLPDDLCRELNFVVGDILLCEKLDDTVAIVLSKHINQTLSDTEIESAGNLTRIILIKTEDVSME